MHLDGVSLLGPRPTLRPSLGLAEALESVSPSEASDLEATFTWTHPIARRVPDEAGSLSSCTTHSSGCFAVSVEGQLIGGCVQGLGGMLGEELRYDEAGNLLNRGFLDYLIPTAGDVPMVEIEPNVSRSPHTPLGTKGLGEGAPATIVCAVEDLLWSRGVEVDLLPLSPACVLRAMQSARLPA